MRIKVPFWITMLLIIVLPGLLMLLGQVIYEGIYLTYKNGPQNILFSLIHNSPAYFIFLIISYFASMIWALFYIIWVIKIKIEKKKPEMSWIYISTIFIIVFIYLISSVAG
jgi:hypothetical protein